MRVELGIRIRMVHPVHYPVSTGAQVGRPLRNKRYDKEELLPGRAHAERFMRSITVQKKSLGEKRQIPMKDKKDNDRYHLEQNLKTLAVQKPCTHICLLADVRQK